jgi:hypothetical protein
MRDNGENVLSREKDWIGESGDGVERIMLFNMEFAINIGIQSLLYIPVLLILQLICSINPYVISAVFE